MHRQINFYFIVSEFSLWLQKFILKVRKQESTRKPQHLSFSIIRKFHFISCVAKVLFRKFYETELSNEDQRMKSKSKNENRKTEHENRKRKMNV